MARRVVHLDKLQPDPLIQQIGTPVYLSVSLAFLHLSGRQLNVVSGKTSKKDGPRYKFLKPPTGGYLPSDDDILDSAARIFVQQVVGAPDEENRRLIRQRLTSAWSVGSPTYGSLGVNISSCRVRGYTDHNVHVRLQYLLNPLDELDQEFIDWVGIWSQKDLTLPTPWSERLDDDLMSNIDWRAVEKVNNDIRPLYQIRAVVKGSPRSPWIEQRSIYCPPDLTALLN